MSRRSSTLGIIAAGAGVVLGAWACQRDREAGEEKGNSALSLLAGVRVEYVLTPPLVTSLGAAAGDDFDVATNGDVVLRAGESLLEIARRGDEVVADRLVADHAPDRFALDGGS